MSDTLTAVQSKTKTKARQWGEVRTRNDRPGYRVRFTHGTTTYERAAGSTWNAADAKRRRAHVLLEAGTPIADVLAAVFGDKGGSALTFADAAPSYLEYAGTRKKESTVERDRHRLAFLCEQPWAKSRLCDLKPETLIRWMDDRQKPSEIVRKRARRPGESLAEYRVAKDRTAKVEVPGASGATLNRDLALGSALYRWANRLGHIEGNPFRKVERFSEKGRERTAHLEAAEARALTAACSEPLRPVVAAAVGTGMRLGELLALRWRSVDLKAARLHVEPETEKAGRGRVVPLSPDLVAFLKGLKEVRLHPALDGSDLVFLAGDKEPWNRRALQREFEITVRRCEGIATEKRGSVSFHVLRHTAGTLLAEAGVPLRDIAGLLGQSVQAVTARYAHFTPAMGERAVDRLARALHG